MRTRVNRLLVLAARLSQVHVQVDQSWSDHLARGIQHLGAIGTRDVTSDSFDPAWSGMSTQTKIRNFLEELLNNKGDSSGFTDQQLLVTEGRLSSLDVITIVLFLEENYGIDFSDRPFDQNEFDSVESITALVDTVIK